MANLFKGYEKISPQEFAQQITLLKTATLGNTLRFKIGKLYRTSISEINTISSIIGKTATLTEPESKEFSDEQTRFGKAQKRRNCC